MYRNKQNRSLSTSWRLAASLWLVVGSAFAQSPAAASADGVATLQQAYAAAWRRQPEAKSLDLRLDVAAARRQAADSWLAEPPALELSAKTDRVTGNDGNREYVAGFALPLWLPGERSRSASLADAEAKANLSRASAAQLRTAAAVREAWWNWQRAQGEQTLTQDRLTNARRLVEDVGKRVKAGDLARSDRHQAEGAVATAEVAAAEAETAFVAAKQQLRVLIGQSPEPRGASLPEPMPAVPADFSLLDSRHPAVVELFDRAEVARRSAELASVQTRANPELTLLTTRQRDAFGNDWDQSITVGVRIPFGSASRNRAKAGAARAEAIEAEGQARLERERLVADLDAAWLRVDTAQTQLAAAEKRARLASESRGFFEKSFRFGETDLPTRLRVELEAVEAERQAARARIDHAAAVSALRQALGLLPE